VGVSWIYIDNIRVVYDRSDNHMSKRRLISIDEAQTLMNTMDKSEKRVLYFVGGMILLAIVLAVYFVLFMVVG